MKILVVDDNVDNIEMLAILLKSQNYEVKSAFNGKEALEMLHSDKYDLIISDILMPVMDGFQFCRECKKDIQLSNINFIFYTATYIDYKDKEFALSLGAQEFILKPQEPEAFLNLIDKAIEKSKKEKNIPTMFVEQDEKEIFKLYNERLVNKLEKKNLDLEKEIATRKIIENELITNELKLTRLNRLYLLLSRVNEMIIRVKDKQKIFDEVCSIIVETGQFVMASIGLTDENLKINMVSKAGFEEGYFEKVTITADESEYSKGPTGTAIKSGKYFFINDIENNKIMEPWQVEAKKRGYRSSAAFPVKLSEKIIGSLNVYSDKVGFFQDDELSLLERLANDISFALEAIENENNRKKAEEEILKLNLELEHRVVQRTAELKAANKELEAFSYSVSHDLRSPLRAIDSFTRILMADNEKLFDDEGKRIGNLIRESTHRMGQLIDDLLAFSRLSRSEMRISHINMNMLINSVFDELTTAEMREKIKFDIGEICNAQGDPSLIKQVWVNLISNAVKYSSFREKSIISITCTCENGMAEYCIKDNGAGFDMLYANKLFGVFQRLHNNKEFEGTGVGLAIVQRIVQRHGGRVWAEGEVDKGAAFYFTLPVKTKSNGV